MNKIKQLRKKKGLTLQQVADGLTASKQGKKPISKSTVLRWENGKNSPTAEMWGLLADYFGVSVDFLKGDCPFSHRFAKPVWYCYATNAPMGAKRVRERRGLTIKQVSEATGIPSSTLSQYENGRRKQKPEALEKLSNYYGVDQKILLFRGRQETK